MKKWQGLMGLCARAGRAKFGSEAAVAAVRITDPATAHTRKSRRAKEMDAPFSERSFRMIRLSGTSDYLLSLYAYFNQVLPPPDGGYFQVWYPYRFPVHIPRRFR